MVAATVSEAALSLRFPINYNTLSTTHAKPLRHTIATLQATGELE